MYEQLNWDLVQQKFDEYSAKAEPLIDQARHWVKQYPAQLQSEEGLHSLLAQLNVIVLDLGELQSDAARIKQWTDTQYDIEKSKEFIKLVKGGKPVTYANGAKYVGAEEHLNLTVNSASLHLRLQNARASARDTTEGIRSRISTIKGSIRSTN